MFFVLNNFRDRLNRITTKVYWSLYRSQFRDIIKQLSFAAFNKNIDGVYVSGNYDFDDYIGDIYKEFKDSRINEK